MTKEDIDRQMREYTELFYSQKYDNEIPQGFVEKFKKAIGIHPLQGHLMQAGSIRRIIQKQESMLTYMEVGQMTKVLMAVRPDLIHKDLDETIDWIEKLQALTFSYEKAINKFDASVQRKMRSLMELANKTTTFQAK